MTCDNCGSNQVWRDEVDIGVGIQYGPWQCPDCGWYEGHQNDFEPDFTDATETSPMFDDPE